MFVEDDSLANVTLRVRHGDQFISELAVEDIDFIKVDVEGHEIRAFTGLVETIEKFQPVVTFEFLGKRQPKDEYYKICQLLKGYSFYECDLGLRKNLAFIVSKGLNFGGLPILRPILNIESRTYSNILAMPEDFDFKNIKHLLSD